jgi:EAL domain-containing protein (putative c-di-GMP-specific phosphodiesterase class I)/ActR/RegA family two-component response regulator
MRPSTHLLIVDDQRLDRAIATHAAVRIGVEATGTASVDETRQVLECGARFDFVLLDLSLGADDGLAVLPLLSRFCPDAVVVLASGFEGRILNASHRLAASLGIKVAGVLRKPILPAALQRILRQQPMVEGRKSSHAPLVLPEHVRRALADGSIRPWFQPKTSLMTNAIVGTEALARWIDPDGKAVAPNDFIPVAEEAGLIAELTDSMLGKALQACARWRLTRPDCWVAVNISPLLLDDPGLTDRIEQHLQETGVPPNALVLEITETSGIPETPHATEILTRLRIRGVNLSIDDFGTGHSSLRSLIRMPFNEMKIDQSFVREAVADRDSRKVVRASASLGRELGLKVVAEGVETGAMADLVMEAGCHVGQGWLYGRAMAAEVFEQHLALDVPADTQAEPSDTAG